MKQWLYTVWFRDHDLSPDDQDHEWNACIVIEANSSDNAIEWGDILSKKYCVTNVNLKFLRSTIEAFIKKPELIAYSLPVIKYGHIASDSEIGW